MLVERRRIVFILSVIFFIAFVGVLDSDVYGAKKTPPGKVKIKSASQTKIPIYEYGESGKIVGYMKKQSVRIKWKHVKNADGYVVYRKYKKGKYKAIKNIKVKKAKAAGSILKYTTPQVKKGKYYFKIAAYKLYAGKKYYGKKSSAKGTYVKPKKAIKRWNIGCGSKSTIYGSAKAKKNVKATLYNNGELIISGKGNAQYSRGHFDEEDDDDESSYDGMPWYCYGRLIDKVTIKKGVAPKSIDGWFYDLRKLRKAPQIPSGVKDMGETFSCCTSLKQAPKIPSGVKYMNSTFADCISLKQSPKIPSGVKYMNSTFADCTSLKQAPKIPSGVNSMDSTFEGCESLEQAPEIPAGVKNMHGTFSKCKSLTKGPSSIPSSVEDMSYTFWYCKSITGTIRIKTTLANVTHKDDDYEYYSCGDCFDDAATDYGCQIRLDYVDEALVDEILKHIYSESHVVKGNYIG